MLKKGNNLLQLNNNKIPAFETNQKNDSDLFIDVRKEMNKQKLDTSDDPVKYQQQEILLSSLLNSKDKVKDVVVLNQDYMKQEHEFSIKPSDS